MINLKITDDSTGRVTVIQQTNHDANKLYLALRELFGDVQYQAQPGALITVPNAELRLTGRHHEQPA